MRQVLCSAETKEQAASSIVLGGKTLSWLNNAVAEHLQGLCVTALVRGTAHFCIGKGPSVPLLPVSRLALGKVGPCPELWLLAATLHLGGCFRNWKLAL